MACQSSQLTRIALALWLVRRTGKCSSTTDSKIRARQDPALLTGMFFMRELESNRDAVVSYEGRVNEISSLASLRSRGRVFGQRVRTKGVEFSDAEEGADSKPFPSRKGRTAGGRNPATLRATCGEASDRYFAGGVTRGQGLCPGAPQVPGRGTQFFPPLSPQGSD